MPYHFGDVIVVPFPFTDQTTTKKRPAVVVSSEAYHRERPDLILMAITSQLRPAPAVGAVPVKVGLHAEDQDGLPVLVEKSGSARFCSSGGQWKSADSREIQGFLRARPREAPWRKAAQHPL
jgi:mRNA-degrading endonuclease toxin of MazEF toxin-antitoxin module